LFSFLPELPFALSFRTMTGFLFSDFDDNFMIPSRAIDRVDRSYLLCVIMMSATASGNLSLSFSTTSTMADIQALLTALDVFTRAPDKVSLEKANAWLQDFQHSVITLSPWPPTTTSDSPPSACSHSLRRGRPVTSFYDRQMHPPLQSYLQLKHSGQRSASLC